MKAEFELKDPSKLQARIELEATMGEFKEILGSLKKLPFNERVNYTPLGSFIIAIEDVIADAEKHFYKYVTQPSDEVTK